MDAKLHEEKVSKVLENIRDSYTELGYRQRDFGKLLGWNQAKFQKLINHKTKPYLYMIFGMCEALEKEVHQIFPLPEGYMNLKNEKGEWIGIIKKTELDKNK